MEHLAETFHVIFGDVNFTVSDRHAALVLATALQQARRHDHIKDCLIEGADPLASHELLTNKLSSLFIHMVVKSTGFVVHVRRLLTQ